MSLPETSVSSSSSSSSVSLVEHEPSETDHTPEESSVDKLSEKIKQMNLKPPAPVKNAVDLFSEPAMNNAVNISHNIQVKTIIYKKKIKNVFKDFLFFRGYQWSNDEEPKEKKRKKKKKKPKYHSIFNFNS